MNHATLAVAGARKTQSIVDSCAAAEIGCPGLVLSFTISGQADVQRRLQRACPAGVLPDVMGWYAFLLNQWIRPYIPLLYRGRRLKGLNFDGTPSGGRFAKGESRFLDSDSRAYQRHLSKLAIDVATASNGAVVNRLERIYRTIYIDEVQDLTGYDLDIVEKLLRSKVDLRLVGDVRQSIFDTNPHDPRHRKYRGLKMLDWFGDMEKLGLLRVEQSTETWRSVQEIATFSDGIFREELGLPSTTSRQIATSDHIGVYAVQPEHVMAYAALHAPTCLRYSRAVATPEHLAVANFGVSKGETHQRILIFPTGSIRDFLRRGVKLADKPASGFYVAVTRAVLSVAVVTERPWETGLRVWVPSG